MISSIEFQDENNYWQSHNQNQICLTKGHWMNKWSTVSTCPQKWQAREPDHPLSNKLFLVKILFCVSNHMKILFLGEVWIATKTYNGQAECL